MRMQEGNDLSHSLLHVHFRDPSTLGLPGLPSDRRSWWNDFKQLCWWVFLCTIAVLQIVVIPVLRLIYVKSSDSNQEYYFCASVPIQGILLSWSWLQCRQKPYFPRLRWLEVMGSVDRDIADALARSRPFLNVACHGEELGSRCWDSFSNLCGSEYEEIDELEQWLIEGEEDCEEDEGMEDELI